jgi:hypothetical protein
MAKARPTKPIFEVFSLRCGTSETIDAGTATESLGQRFKGKSTCKVFSLLGSNHVLYYFF